MGYALKPVLELSKGEPVKFGPHNQPVMQSLCHGHAGPVRFISSMEVSERRESIDKRRMSAPASKKSILVTGGDG